MYLSRLARYGTVARSTPCQSSATVIAATSSSSLCAAIHPLRSKAPFSPLMITSASMIIAIGLLEVAEICEPSASPYTRLGHPPGTDRLWRGLPPDLSLFGTSCHRERFEQWASHS